MRLRIAIVDDEDLARAVVREYLEGIADVEIVAECANGFEAVKAVSDLQPDLLILDVQMPKLNGFEVLELVGRDVAVVFVTAFDQYALRAFEVHAVDYLLKPYDTARFRQAFARARERLGDRDRGRDESRLRAMLRDLVAERAPGSDEVSHHGHVAVRTDGTLKVVRTADGDYWESPENYGRAHVGPTSHLFRTTSSKLETKPDPRPFFPLTRRYVVNL